MSVKCVPLQTPLLYSKTGVCRGIPIFLIFAPKHRLWVLPTIYVWSKNKKITENFLLLFFYNFKNLCILHGHVFVIFDFGISNKPRREKNNILHDLRKQMRTPASRSAPLFSLQR